ncbi:Cerato-platanin [Dentipellis sp. KUC8613]|nr:Cerato-platanin [Dentipellis sp. KUC8613]
MKFFAAFTSLFAFSTLALADTIRYDTTYDNAGQSMNTVSCSDGPKGLVGKFPTFGSLPDFPNLGAAAAIAGWGSDACGTCWAISYNGVTVNIVAVDHADDGFNLSLEAMNTLTDGQAQFLGSVEASVQQVAPSQCGL